MNVGHVAELERNKMKALVAFYSRTGTTPGVAEDIPKPKKM